ncbi:MAG: sulfide/dihydroorotate dehydrogenase-like FAD/NAD-binding protein, partial [Coriobacteriia bacterium]|nr:sulfide/dihydroorotate dehydrogenase-like FAD/NAD-binding protein [Coriobacteriia bacterium]
ARRVMIVGGGLGCAIAYPQAKSLMQAGLQVEMIAGFRSHDLVILEDEMRATTHRLYVTTDDGSYGEHGFVTTKLEELLNDGEDYDLVIAIGPTVMMKFLCQLTANYNLPTIVSLNPIMVDGTGLCGCCRVTINGETKFACIDGPDFDGHSVDFDELMARNAFYTDQEASALKNYQEHICKLTGEVR